MDADIKRQFDALCQDFGMSANTAFNIFARSVVRSRSIPFEIQADSKETIAAKESRTRRILDAAKEALSSRYNIESIDVNEAALLPLTPKSLAERSSGIVPEATVALARKIAAADRIIIAAPFWDMSFPAALKA